jgi:DNA repair protein RecO (recombination protein O)
MPIHKTEAIVIRKYDFRETSMIANFYTRDFGKISGILKGIRSEPTKFSSAMENFSHNDIIFYARRNSGLHLISQCELKDNFFNLRHNVAKVGICSVMMELLDSVMPAEDKNEEVFDLAISSLKELETSVNPDKILTIFKIKILSLSGFEPHFDSCACCNCRITGESKFSLSLGGLVCPRCYKKDPRARTIFRGTVASILHIQKNDFRTNLNLGLNLQIKKELNLILNAFLTFHLEKELKTEKVLGNINNFSASPTLISGG